MRLDVYDLYQMFMSLRNHFNQKSFDYFKYGGKIRSSKDSFMNNKDRFKYARLAREYDAAEMRDFLVANFIKGKKWIGEFLEDDADENYKAFLKRKQSFQYNFKNEVESLFGSVSKPNEVFQIIDGQYPIILNKVLSDEISIETFTVLNHFIQFTEKFDKAFGKDDIIWSRLRLLSTKLEPFIEYKKETTKKVLKELLT